MDPVCGNQIEGSHLRVCELLVKKDALISKYALKKIPEKRRPELEENEVRMNTADGSLLPDNGEIIPQCK